MSTTTEHLEHGKAEHEEEHFSDFQYVIVALILAAPPARDFFEMEMLSATEWFLALLSAAREEGA